ncbi:membrane protein [Dictyobacter sp. S3.2.2.5]|uniref:Membrane protein n=1 Tax=Dictyobacter halimunensis TaxID=3026934 RepID=A0ABQ6FM97_9CHLR|nr:membrane protein [Dictyobacter sp. S3.2.2.5]GLV54899.1 membrane protein [Dictyobacter sp. S3.2.2.5]
MLLASLISLQALQDALHVIGYPAIALFIMIECIGIPIPGETMLLLASFYAATDSRLQIPIVIACAAFGAIMGDNIGYYVGRTGGRTFVSRFGRYFFIKLNHLDYAERFFQRHGAKTVFFGRFISILRIFSAFLAGVNRMEWRTFLVYNGLGGVIWATYVGLLGYIAGHYFHEHFDQVESMARTVGWVGFAIAIIITVAAVIFVKKRIAHTIASSEVADESKEHSLR